MSDGTPVEVRNEDFGPSVLSRVLSTMLWSFLCGLAVVRRSMGLEPMRFDVARYRPRSPAFALGRLGREVARSVFSSRKTQKRLRHHLMRKVGYLLPSDAAAGLAGCLGMVMLVKVVLYGTLFAVLSDAHWVYVTQWSILLAVLLCVVGLALLLIRNAYLDDEAGYGGMIGLLTICFVIFCVVPCAGKVRAHAFAVESEEYLTVKEVKIAHGAVNGNQLTTSTIIVEELPGERLGGVGDLSRKLPPGSKVPVVVFKHRGTVLHCKLGRV